MSTRIIHGIYDDDEKLLNGAKKLRSGGIQIKEVFSPFPVHGLDPVLGIPRTRIAICSFIYGCTGLVLGSWMMWYMMITDWPTDIGGKPNLTYYYNVPAFIPPTFEMTVFCAAHLMFLTFLLRSWILPGVKANNPDPRTTDDRFLMLIEAKENDVEKIKSFLSETGASEINLK